MEHVPVWHLDFATEAEEVASDFLVAGFVHGERHERTVAWPYIGIGIAVELHDVAVASSQDATVFVDVCACDEQAALIQIGYFAREGSKFMIHFIHPTLPVVVTVTVQAIWRFDEYRLLELEDFFEVLTQAHPEHGFGWLFAFDMRLNTDGGIHRTLFDRVTSQLAVLCVLPGAF